MNIQAILSDIQAHWYADIEHTISRDTLQKCIDTFRIYIKNTSLEERESTDFRYDPSQRFSVWFRDKSTSEGFDEKCYFHYNRILRNGQDSITNPHYQAFLLAMWYVYDELDTITHQIWDALIAHWYLANENFYSSEGTTNSNLRILQYRPQESCEYLAKPHTDRGIFTLTVYESDPGLRFYMPHGEILPITNAEWVLRMFPTDFWNRYVSYRLEATTHDVIKEPWNRERGSMVLFVNPAFGKGPYSDDDNISGYALVEWGE